MADEVNDAVEATLHRASVLFSSGHGTTISILKEADANLSKRLHNMVKATGGPTGKFNESSAILARKQIRLVTEYLESRLLGHTHEQAKKAVQSSYKATVSLAKKLEKKFTGITKPLNVESQAMQDAVTRGTNASLLQRHQNSVARYGKTMIGKFERVLRVGALEGLSNHELVSRLVDTGKLGGINAKKLHAKEPAWFPKPTGFIKERYWAERIVRTEKAYAYNAAGLKTIQTAKVVDFPDMQKKILATFDNRTAQDSVIVHGQIRETDELFTDGAGRQYLHPPARPNDRETVVPWRPHWAELEATVPAPPEVQAQAQQAMLPVADQASKTKEERKAALQAAFTAAKAKIDAQKVVQTQAAGIEQAKAAAEQAHAQGQKLAGHAVAMDQAKLAQVAEKSSSVQLFDFEAKKAKAAEYMAKKKAAAAAIKEQRDVERAAKVKARASEVVSEMQTRTVLLTGKEAVAQLSAIGKKNPKLLENAWAQVLKKPLSQAPKVTSKNATLVAKAVIKKMDPTWAAQLKPKKKKPVDLFAVLDAGAAAEKAKLKALKYVESGHNYIDVFDEQGTKVTYFKKKSDDLFEVNPPGQTMMASKQFTTQEAAAEYGLLVSKAIKEKAEKAKPAVSFTKKSATITPAPAKDVGWSEKYKRPSMGFSPRSEEQRVAVLAQDFNAPDRNGVALDFDSDWIENFNVTVQTEWVGKKRQTVARFKVTQHRSQEIAARMRELPEHKNPPPKHFRRLEDESSKELRFQAKGGERTGFEPVKVADADVDGMSIRFMTDPGAVSRTTDSVAALHNTVEVRFDDSSPEDRMAKLKAALTKLGVQAEKPTAKDVRRYRRAKILSATDKISLLELGGDPSKADEIWEKTTKRLPVLKEIEADAVLREVAPGQYALYSERLAKVYTDAGVTRLEHQITGGWDSLKVMEQVLLADKRGGGLLSSRERFNRGLIYTGMSTKEDFRTGGADNVFLRHRTTPATVGSRYKWRIDVDTSELGRLDAYQFNSDVFGRAGPGMRERRDTALSMANKIMNRDLQTDNEVMMQRQVPRSSIRQVIAPDEQSREALLQKFRDEGTTEVNGVPIEEFVR